MPTSPTHHKLAIFGGSGATGIEVIRAALERGISVNALVRNRTSLNRDAENFRIIEGAILSPADIESTLEGCDAVCCVFGPRPPYVDLFCADATRAIIAAMRSAHVDRIICQTGGMIGDYPANRSLPFKWMVNLFNKKLPHIALDRAEQERIVSTSSLVWTIVKPPRLTNERAKNQMLNGPTIRLGMLSSITRTDLATFLAEEVYRTQYPGQAIFVKN